MITPLGRLTFRLRLKRGATHDAEELSSIIHCGSHTHACRWESAAASAFPAVAPRKNRQTKTYNTSYNLTQNSCSLKGSRSDDTTTVDVAVKLQNGHRDKRPQESSPNRASLVYEAQPSMDPLSALGMAASIIQFVDFTTKLFNEAREVYHSASGSSPSVHTLASLSAELSALSKSFSPDDLKSLGLGRVAAQCSDIAKEIQLLVKKLTLEKPSDGYWRNFAVALKTVLNKEKIEDLGKRVDKIQLQLGLQMQRLVL